MHPRPPWRIWIIHNQDQTSRRLRHIYEDQGRIDVLPITGIFPRDLLLMLKSRTRYVHTIPFSRLFVLVTDDCFHGSRGRQSCTRDELHGMVIGDIAGQATFITHLFGMAA